MPTKDVIRIAHTADTHLRHSQFGSKQRGQHFFNSFCSVIEVARDQGAGIIVNSGDILDKNRQRTENIQQLVQADQLLKKYDMTMYCITGNHDMDKPTWLETLFSENPEQGPGIVPVDNREIKIPNTDIRLAGMPTHDVDDWIVQLDVKRQLGEETPEIILWHGAVGGFMKFDVGLTSYEKVLEAAPGTKLFLLGDLHVNKYHQQGDQVIGYPGSSDMCSIDEDENKYINIFTLDPQTCKVLGHKSHLIESTPVLRINMATADDAGSSMLASYAAEVDSRDFTLVHLVFDAEFQKEANILISMLDKSKCIVRRKRVSKALQFQESSEGKVLQTMTPVDLVDRFIEKGDLLYPFAKQLADPNVDFKVVIERLIYEHAPKRIKAL